MRWTRSHHDPHHDLTLKIYPPNSPTAQQITKRYQITIYMYIDLPMSLPHLTALSLSLYHLISVSLCLHQKASNNLYIYIFGSPTITMYYKNPNPNIVRYSMHAHVLLFLPVVYFLVHAFLPEIAFLSTLSYFQQ
jgi:hypothetical protein